MDYCSQLTQAAQTPLYGTAAQFRIGFLLEYDGEWRNKAIANNNLPGELGSWFNHMKKTIPATRLLFIRKGARDYASDDLTKSFYVTVNDVDAPRIYRFDFNDYSELLEIDVPQLVAGTSDVAPVNETIIAVCTNGKHDACCAKFGLPVCQSFAKEFEHESNVSVWQCTHIGGHRYAATAVVVPSGIVYGYLTPDNVPNVAGAIRSQEIHLPCYRGRTLYSGTTSAADYYLRDATGQTALDAFSLVSSVQLSGDEAEALWQVKFKNGSSSDYVVELTQRVTEPQVSSCGDKPLKPQIQYRLVNEI